jgi:hypothetical protein
MDVFLIPFSLYFLAFAVFWETSVLRIGRAPVLFDAMGGVFVLISLYIVFGRFIVDAWIRARTIYAVTDQRIIIVAGLVRQEVRSLYLEGLAEMNVSERRSGRGTITFGRATSPWWPSPWGFTGFNAAMPPAFEAIKNCRAVTTLIREAQRALRRSA